MDDNNLTDKDKYLCGRSGCNFSTNYCKLGKNLKSVTKVALRKLNKFDVAFAVNRWTVGLLQDMNILTILK